MDHSVLVEIADRRASLSIQCKTLPGVQCVVGAEFVDRRSIDVVHDKVGKTVDGRAAIDDPGYVYVVEPGEDLALLAESVNQPLRRQFSADHLDRADPLKDLVSADSLVNDTHPAAAEFLQYLVRADIRPKLARSRRCLFAFVNRSIEYPGSTLVGLEQLFHGIQQPRVTDAGAGKKLPSKLGGLIKCGFKQLPHTSLALVDQSARNLCLE